MPNDPDHFLKIVPALLTATGFLSSALCWPLAQGKIGPNRFYGIRTKFAFSSEENWYKANRFGGRVFVRTGLLIGLVGLVGLFVPDNTVVFYSLGAAFLVLALVIGSGIVIFLGQGKDHPE